MTKILNMRLIAASMLCAIASFNGFAQKPSYNHDAAKMNQITVMETGAGALTPIIYYRLLHNNYQKSAAAKNKLGFRSLAGIGAYQQIEYADSIEAYLKARAEVEALNMADRQIDLAWKTEGNKINDKLDAFHNNINRIVPAGGTPKDRQRWDTYYKMFQTAIKATREAYMPNAQRKREYLNIYADLSKQNEILVKQLVQMHNKSRTEQLLASRNNYRTADKAAAVASANSKWREAGLSTKQESSSAGNDTSDGGEEKVDR
jgi:hypothetical protein